MLKNAFFLRKKQVFIHFFGNLKQNPRPIFASIKTPQKSGFDDPKVRAEFIKGLSKVRSSSDLPALLINFKPKIANLRDFIEIQAVLNAMGKQNIKSSEILSMCLEKINEEKFLHLGMNEKSTFLSLITRVCEVKDKNPVDFTKIEAVFQKFFTLLLNEIKGKELNNLTPSKANNLLYSMQFFNFVNEDFLNVYLEYFAKNVETFGPKETVSALMSFAKLLAHYEKVGFVKKTSTNLEPKKRLLSLYSSTPRLEKKVKSLISAESTDLQIFIDLAYSLSRLEVRDPDVWAAIIDKLARNMKTLEDKKFQIALGAITAFNQCKNPLLLSEFKSHFDTRLIESPSNITPEYIVRCLRAFSVPGMGIITNKDPSMQLYEELIEKKAGDFKMQQNIALLYFFAQINYENQRIIEKIIKNVLSEVNPESFDKNEHLTLFFWSGAALPHTIEAFWLLYSDYIRKVDFTFMNDKNLVNNMIPFYLLLKRSGESSPEIKSKYRSLQELSFEKVFKGNCPLEAHQGFDLYHICKAMGLKIHPEVFVEVSPVDFYIENFLEIDFDERLRNLQEIVQEYERIFPGKCNQIELTCKFTSLKEIEEFVRRTKNNAVLIEVQGPSHYIMDEGNERGSSLMKMRIIKNAGYNRLVMKQSLCKSIGELPNISEKIQRVLEIFNELKMNILKNNSSVCSPNS